MNFTGSSEEDRDQVTGDQRAGGRGGLEVSGEVEDCLLCLHSQDHLDDAEQLG